jgi:predicted solute-binding protein
MKSTQLIKLEEAINRADEFVRIMSRWNDKKLEKHLDLYREQKTLALKANKMEAFELLCEYEDQVILARLAKLK